MNVCMKFFAIFILLISEQSFSQNLIVNGDFSQGNFGFISDFAYGVAGSQGDAYNIETSPAHAHSAGAVYSDQSGDGNMMVVNGVKQATTNNVAWKQTVSVSPGTDYKFSVFVSSWYLGGRAELKFRVNGGDMISGYLAPNSLGIWDEVTFDWSSGASTSAEIEILNTSVIYLGNAFALDGISFESKTIPPPVNLIVNGDFSQGDTGFQSAFPYGVYESSGLGAFTYVIGTDPSAVHWAGAKYSDHSGDGKMMIVHGRQYTSQSNALWSQTVSVAPNTIYRFSAYVSSWYAANPAELTVSMNGIDFMPGYKAPATVATWSPDTFLWESGSATQLTIVIKNTSYASLGNTFALDSISLQPIAGACSAQ